MTRQALQPHLGAKICCCLARHALGSPRTQRPAEPLPYFDCCHNSNVQEVRRRKVATEFRRMKLYYAGGKATTAAQHTR